MPSIKKSVMFSETTQAFIAARTRGGETEISWSESLNETFKAHKWLLDQLLPDLSNDEWQTILNCYAGTWIDFHPPLRIASDLMDDVGALSLDDLVQDYAALVKKVHGLSQPEQLAVMDFVKKFWAADWSHCKNFEEIKNNIKSL